MVTQIETLGMLSARAAECWGARPALIFDELSTTLSFVDVEQRSNAWAHLLLHAGITSGDRVAVMLRNRPDFALVWLGVGKIGAVLTPINVFARDHDAGYVLKHSGARLIVTESDFVPLLSRLRPGLPDLRDILVSNGADAPELLHVRDLLRRQPASAPATPVFGETPVNIQYTSGTTGRPKGCVLTHGYWMTIARHNVAYFPLIDKNDIMLAAQPFYYMDPQWMLATALAAGATLVVLDRFHPSTYWEKVREYRATYLYCLGVMPTLLLKHPPSPEAHTHCVRRIQCAGIPPYLHRELEARWGILWYEVYGTTETGTDIGISAEGHEHVVGQRCLGYPYPHREVRIIAEDQADVACGEVGELLLRGIGMMRGYFRDPDATATVFRNGWLHTGDLARMDQGGRIYYVGRKKEVIRRSGENVSAAEVEGTLLLNPLVDLAACVAVADALRGEEVLAVVVLRDEGLDLTSAADELATYCTQHLAYFKIPRYWAFKRALPLTPSGKVAKQALREEFAERGAGTYDRVERRWR